MTAAEGDDDSDLRRALHRRGGPMSTSDFLEVLEEISPLNAEHLSEGERDFLLAHTDLTHHDLNAEGRGRTQLHITVSRELADEELAERSLSTSQVATVLGRNEANIRRSRLQGALYSPGENIPGRSRRFPQWQFVNGGVVPGLRAILPSFPRHTHPLSIEWFMTNSNENLGDRSPVEWLVQGGSPDAVAELADKLGYE